MEGTTTGFSTINQLITKSIFCGTGKEQQGCKINDRCCRYAIGSSNINEQVIEDLAIALKKISKSFPLRLGYVAAILTDLIADIKNLFKKTDEMMSRQKLVKIIVKTFKSFENIPLIERKAIEVANNRIIEVIRLMKIDLQKITEARTVESKNLAASDLGQHIITLSDITAELTKIISGVCNLSDKLSEEIFSITLVTTTIFFFVEQTLATNALQVNKVGFRNDTAFNICAQISPAVEQYVVVIQHISQCSNVQFLKELLPTLESSLRAIRIKLSDGIGSVAGFSNKHPESPSLSDIINGIMDSVRNSKHLKEAEAPIRETLISLFDVSKSILAASLSCFSISGFEEIVDPTVHKILVYLHATFFMIVNIDDDWLTSANSLSMLLATMDSIVLKIVCTVDDLMQSILSLGKITDGSASIIKHIFEAVVSVAASVTQCVALIFGELINGSHLVNLSQSVPHIMLGAKSQINAANDKLLKYSEACSNDYNYNVDTFIEASLTVLSFNEFQNNIAKEVSNLDCNSGDAVVRDVDSTKVDSFVGKIKSSAERLIESSEVMGKVTVGAVNEILDEVYDTLMQLSTVSLERGEVLKLICLTISNFYFAVVTLNSVFNCFHYGVNMSVF